MKTGDLIDLLAQDAPPLARGLVWRRLGAGLVAGGAVALLAVVLWLRCQPLLAAAAQPWFWMKAAYTAALTLTALVVVRRLATPGATLRSAPAWVVGVFVAMALLGAGQLLAAPPATRLAIWLGRSWQVCSPLILLLSVPIYAALVVAVRATLAPIHPIRTGAAIGLTAGALAATIYGLHCPEQGAAFVVTWYSLGMAAAAAAGALAGRWWLRW